MKEVFPYNSENINRQIQYFAENELERHAVLSGGKENDNGNADIRKRNAGHAPVSSVEA